MEGLKSKIFLLFLAFMLMITIYLPIFYTHSRFNIGVHKYWAVVWFISLLWFAPRTFTNKSLLYTFFYLIILVFILLNTLWASVDEWNKREARAEVLSFLVPMSLYVYFSISRDFDGLALLLKWTLIFIAITAILTIYSSTIDPLYVRKLSFEAPTEEEKALMKLGGGLYGFAGALIFLFPIIVYYYRNSSKIPFTKPQILIFGVLCFVAVLRMQIFANIILSVLVIGLSLLGTKRIRKTIVIIGIFLSLMFLIPKQAYSNLLIDASRYFPRDSEVFFKLNDMATFIELGSVNEETGIGGRVERYPLLWKGFKNNPVTGFFNSRSSLDIAPGAHLYWMNKLTVYGFLGFIPFIFIFYLHIKKTIKLFDKEFTFYFLLSVGTGLGLGLMKSLFGKEYWCMFFFIIPSLYYLPLLKKKSSNIRK